MGTLVVCAFIYVSHVLCCDVRLSASREVNHNLERMLAEGRHLDENPFWHFVIENAPEALYQGYKVSLYGLVSDQLGGGLRVPTAVLPREHKCACVTLQL